MCLEAPGPPARSVLLCRLNGAGRRLEGSWILDFDEAGDGFVSPVQGGAEPEWVSELVPRSACVKAADGLVYSFSASGQDTTIVELAEAREVLYKHVPLPINADNAVAEITVKCYIFRIPRCGQRIFWQLRDIQDRSIHWQGSLSI